MGDLGRLLLWLLFLLSRWLFGGIRPVEDSLCTCDNVLNVHSGTLLREECRLELAASIPDDSPDNGEQNECTNGATRNCTRIGATITRSTGGHTDGFCTLITGARRDKDGVSDETKTPSDHPLETKFATLTTRAGRACRELSWTFYTVAGLQPHYKKER